MFFQIIRHSRGFTNHLDNKVRQTKDFNNDYNNYRNYIK